MTRWLFYYTLIYKLWGFRGLLRYVKGRLKAWYRADQGWGG